MQKRRSNTTCRPHASALRDMAIVRLGTLVRESSTFHVCTGMQYRVYTRHGHIGSRVLCVWIGFHKILHVNNARAVGILRSFMNANESFRRPFPSVPRCDNCFFDITDKRGMQAHAINLMYFPDSLFRCDSVNKSRYYKLNIAFCEIWKDVHFNGRFFRPSDIVVRLFEIPSRYMKCLLVQRDLTLRGPHAIFFLEFHISDVYQGGGGRSSPTEEAAESHTCSERSYESNS